jgi:hypothetical protein
VQTALLLLLQMCWVLSVVAASIVSVIGLLPLLFCRHKLLLAAGALDPYISIFAGEMPWQFGVP